MKYKILMSLLTMSVITLTACSKKKEEPEHVRVQASSPEIVEEVRQEAQQVPAPQEITDEDRERMKKELQDSSRFESKDTANKSGEEVNAELINQLDSIGQPAKE